MITIYHNPRCSKSREGLCFLEQHGIEHKIIKYLDDNISEIELKSILKKLNYQPIQLVRTKEALWKDNFADKDLSGDEIIKIMTENPKLIERPIVINGDKAIVARPAEKIKEIITF